MVTVAPSEDSNTLCIQYIMPSAHLYLREEEVVKLMLEFLHNRQLHISQLSVEREAGIINASLSDDLLFLRQLILDGQWDDALEFVQPLSSVESFNTKKFHYEVLKVKYVELLCIKSEAGAQDNMDQAVEEVVKVLNELEKYCEAKEEYAALCLLLTLPRLGDHSDYRDWNPSAARVACFRAVLPLVEKFLPSERKRGGERQDECASNDRLIQLLIKGILYESCVEYCQQKATSGGAEAGGEMQFSKVLSGNGFSDTDLSLLSWLQSIPADTFACPFEQRTLNVDVERLERPQLDAFWTEYMLVTPIKPKTFPHSVMPQARPKSADVMSRSLNPQLEGLPLGLGASRAAAAAGAAADAMSQSLASFHLTGAGRKTMNTSVDRLFDSETTAAGELATIAERHEPLSSQVSPSQPPPPPPPKSTVSTAGTVVSSGSDRSSSMGSTRRPAPATPSDGDRGSRPGSRPGSEASDSPQTTRRRPEATHHPATAVAAASAVPPPSGASSALGPPSKSPATVGGGGGVVGGGGAGGGPGGDLYQEFQRGRQRLQEQLAEHEQRRNQYVQQLTGDNRYSEDGYRPTQPYSPAHAAYGQLNGSPRPGVPPHHSSVPPHHPSHHPSVAPHHPSVPPHHPAGPPHHPGGPMPGQPMLGTPQRQPAPTNGVYQAVNLSRGMSPSMTPQRAPPSRNPGHTIMGELPPDPAGLQAGLYDANKTEGGGGAGGAGRPRFIPVTSLEDVQAIRCAEFHPYGKLYAVGSNSKTLRICSYPKLTDLRDDHVTYQPTVLFKRTKHHKGSIYCLAWSPVGDLIATGSNDKTIKLMRFNADTCNIEGQEIDLTMHDGTVRDLCFIEDMSNKSSLLISGGAGDCKIYVTDCVTGTPFQALSGHSGHILSLYTWGGAMFVSGSHDRTVRFWDLRSRGCVNLFHPPSAHAGSKGAPVASVAVDPSGRLLVTGHEDATCNLYDIRGGRNIQSFRPHESDIRSVRFSPSAYYLLTGGYDNRTVLTDLQGDLTMPLPSVIVAEHQDKVITGRWHPNEFSFLSTGADKTCTLWALPPL